MDPNSAKIILIKLARAILSAAAVAAGTWASERGLDIGGELAMLAGAVAVVVVNLVWSIGEGLLKKWKTTAALTVATPAQLEQVVAETPILTRLAESLTVPTSEQETPKV